MRDPGKSIIRARAPGRHFYVAPNNSIRSNSRSIPHQLTRRVSGSRADYRAAKIRGFPWSTEFFGGTGRLRRARLRDIRVAAAGASLTVPAINEGLIPGLGTFRFARYFGLGRTKRMILSGDAVIGVEDFDEAMTACRAKRAPNRR